MRLFQRSKFKFQSLRILQYFAVAVIFGFEIVLTCQKKIEIMFLLQTEEVVVMKAVFVSWFVVCLKLWCCASCLRKRRDVSIPQPNLEMHRSSIFQSHSISNRRFCFQKKVATEITKNKF